MQQNHPGRSPQYSRYSSARRRAGRRRLFGVLAVLVVVVIVVVVVMMARPGKDQAATTSTDATTRSTTVASGSTTGSSSPTDGSGTTVPANGDPSTPTSLAYVPVKGIYITSYTAATKSKFDPLLQLADQTEINAMVIDVKDNSGYVTFNTDSTYAKAHGLVDPRIKDIDALIATLNEHKIIPIARIVCFQDSVLAKKVPSMAVKDKTTGGNWKDPKGAQYLDPYNKQVWEYLVQVAEDATKHGFHEIQFDYVRFPSDGKIQNATFPGKNSTKEDAIAGFLAFAHSRLDKLGVWLSADIFGFIVHNKTDGGIGQQLEKVAANVDIVCPMLYPSHYDKGSYGFDNPNANPYSIVHAAVQEGVTRLAGSDAKLRPWLQDFNLGQPPYGPTQVKAEIRAAEELGIHEWILWNASNKYTLGALRPA